MAEIKKVDNTFILALSAAESRLFFRAVGTVCGAKTKWKEDEIVELRVMNAQIQKQRSVVLAQAAESAQKSAEQADALLIAPPPERFINEEE